MGRRSTISLDEARQRKLAAEAELAVRMIHACGMVDAARYFHFAPGFVEVARGALERGKPIFTDAEMVARGVTRSRLPADNEVVCEINNIETPFLAQDHGNTRSAAAIHIWLSLSAMRRPPCSTFSNCCAMARPNPPPSSGCRSGSWARQSQNRHLKTILTVFLSPLSKAVLVAAP